MYLLFIGVALFVLQADFVKADCGVVSKKEWDGLNPVNVKYLARPVDLVIIQHTATRKCDSDATCVEIVRAIQMNHIENLHMDDIGASFLIGGNGKVYEGVGWLHVGAHTYGYNSKSIGITFIGNFNRRKLYNAIRGWPDWMRDATSIKNKS